jgi:hypothetical protein
MSEVVRYSRVAEKENKVEFCPPPPPSAVCQETPGGILSPALFSKSHTQSTKTFTTNRASPVNMHFHSQIVHLRGFVGL